MGGPVTANQAWQRRTIVALESASPRIFSGCHDPRLMVIEDKSKKVQKETKKLWSWTIFRNNPKDDTCSSGYNLDSASSN
jgi:hypothetical protein